jgi:hypothetical protein
MIKIELVAAQIKRKIELVAAQMKIKIELQK